MSELITKESTKLTEDRVQPEEVLTQPNLAEEDDYPETPVTDPVQDYQAAPKVYVDTKKTEAEAVAQAYTDGKLLVVPSDNLKLSNDTETTTERDGSNWVLGKTIVSTVTGKIKVKFDLKKSGCSVAPTTLVAGKIYVNDVAVGAEHQTSSCDYTTYTDTDIDVEVGDDVQLYVRSVDAPYNPVHQNFRLYWDVSLPDYIDNALDPTITVIKNGTITRVGDTASGAVTTAHGCGKTPKYVRFTAIKQPGTTHISRSVGVYNGTTNSVVYDVEGLDGILGSGTYAVYITDDGTAIQSAVATLDATNITLTWTKTGSPSDHNIYILWEAYA